MPKKRIFIGIIMLLGFCKWANATTDDQDAINDARNSPPNIGNFALPAPQQPGPLLSFGQTLIGRNHVQVQYTDYSVVPASSGGNTRNANITYGFTDDTSLYLSLPIEANYTTVRQTHFLGLAEVVLLQLEHSVYTAGNTKYQAQATLVGAITLPMQNTTSLAQRNTPVQTSTVEYGSPTYFLGGTYNHTTVNWLLFASPGIMLTQVTDHIQLGYQGFYQAGLGRVISSVSDKYILLGLLEFQGQYTAKDKEFGHTVSNTGGNVIALAPSLWLSTKRLILQAGFNFPVVQSLYGNQSPSGYAIAFGVTWTIA